MADLILDMDYNITKAEAKQNKLNREFEISQKEANLIKDAIKKTTIALGDEQKKQASIRNEIRGQVAEMAKLEATLDKIKSGKASADEVINFGSIADAESRLNEMENSIKTNHSLYDKSVEASKKLSSELSKQELSLDKQNVKTQNIGDNIKSISDKSERHSHSWSKTDKNIRHSQSSLTRFKRRVTELIKSALIFSVLTKAFTALRNTFGKFLTQEGTKTAELISKIKGNLATIGRTLYESAEPYIEWLLQKLVEMTRILAIGLANILGQDVKKMAEMAQYSRDTADSAEKATASFDTLQKTEAPQKSTDNNSAKADTNDITNTTDEAINGIAKKLKQIKPLVFIIGSGFAAWKITKFLTQLNILSNKQGGGLLLTILGLVVGIYGYFDAWTNGIDWSNFVTLIGGASVAVMGLFVAFGTVGGAIGLVIGGIALVVLGIKDMVNNGVNGKNILTVAIGSISTAFGVLLIKTKSVGATLKALFSPTGVLVMGVALLVAGIAYLAENWDKLSPAERTITILGALTTALVAAAVAVALFHTSWSVGVAAATIAAGITLLAGTYLFKKANESNIGTDLSSNGSAPSSISQYATYANMSNPIPALATGAILPGGSPMLAWVNDQPKGQPYIEGSIENIAAAFEKYLGNKTFSNPNLTIRATGSLAPLIRLLSLEITEEQNRTSVF